jgi:hypothetical protein
MNQLTQETREEIMLIMSKTNNKIRSNNNIFKWIILIIIIIIIGSIIYQYINHENRKKEIKYLEDCKFQNECQQNFQKILENKNKKLKYLENKFYTQSFPIIEEITSPDIPKKTINKIAGRPTGAPLSCNDNYLTLSGGATNGSPIKLENEIMPVNYYNYYYPIN